ncbi:protein suppressor of white apricot isoform X4 [Drosophila subpulchrella]|uniref:protein suppressor of white apricot isoform X4 n=1 Tax=Drosophila subpulchrella TaxID=1486046 RepID=UPI0018A193B0|nr:protein suppressor of white apricot isoform X4 [Drosophila subpulchrella]
MMPYNVRNAGGGSVGGILRRTGHGSGSGPGSTALSNGNGTGGAGCSASLENHRQTPLELLVFGYACKIFRDDEKAREMDHGKQLIPWMGDVNLKIDRYDVRGALCELAPHEAPPGGYGNRLEYLSAEEQRAEQLCEEERYLFLYNNEEELRLRQVQLSRNDQTQNACRKEIESNQYQSNQKPTTDKETTDIPLDISRESPFLEQVKLAGATSVVVVAVGSPEIQKPTEKFPVKPKVVI